MGERLLLGHLRVAVSAEGLPAHLVGSLDGCFSREPHPGPHADLTLELVRDLHGPPPPVEAIFHFGAIRGYLDQEIIYLSEGRSVVAIDPDGHRIRGRIHPESYAGEGRLVHVMLFIALAIALRRHHFFHLHAGAVVQPGGQEALVVGEANAGKTTVTLALLTSGWGFLGDDAVWLKQDQDRISALGASRPFHVTPQTLALFPRFNHEQGKPSSAKRRDLDPATIYKEQQRHSMKAPSVLLFPRIVHGSETRIRPMGESEAFRLLIRSAALFLVDAMPGRREHFSVIEKLHRQTSHIAIDLGEDLLLDPALLHRLLDPQLAKPTAGA